MAVITVVDPILGLYQKLGETNETASFNIAEGVSTTGISGSGGGGVTIINDGGTLTGTYEGDVLCKGSATLAGNVTVQGKLTVLSDLVNDGGHELTVNGDLIVNNDFLFDHSNPDAVQSNVTVDGNFTIKGYYLRFQQGGQSEARLRVGGNLISSNGFTGTEINANGNNDTAGLDILVYGDMSGFSAVNIYGGNATSGGQGGAGGDLEVYGSYTGQGHIRMYGGNGLTFGYGGSGGYLHCHGNIALGDYDIRMYGGNAEDNNAGNGGNFTCDGTISVEDLDLYGGDVTVTTTGGNGGAGGSIAINGHFGAANDVDAHGGSGGGAGFSGGSGGIIQVDGSIVIDGDIITIGGNCINGISAGNGGYVEVFADISADNIKTQGGGGTNCNGGNGGYVNVHGYINTNNDSVADLFTMGGDCTSTDNSHTSGAGGYITCNHLVWPNGDVYTSAGSRFGATTSAGTGAAASSAGDITIGGDMIVGNLGMNGAEVNTSYKSFSGGAGGVLAVGGSLTIQNDAEINGGSSRAYDGGVSGRVIVDGGLANILNITIQGGASNPEPRIGGDGPATRGSVRDSTFNRGINAESFVYKDGTETVGSSPATANATLQLGGPCHINTFDVENRVGVKVKGVSNIPVTLKLGTMPTKKKLNNSDDAETVDITAISGGLDGNIFSYGITDGEWYYHTGTSLTPP